MVMGLLIGKRELRCSWGGENITGNNFLIKNNMNGFILQLCLIPYYTSYKCFNIVIFIQICKKEEIETILLTSDSAIHFYFKGYYMKFYPKLIK